MEGNAGTDQSNHRASRCGYFKRFRAHFAGAIAVWAGFTSAIDVSIATGFPPLRFESAAERMTGAISRSILIRDHRDPAGGYSLEAGRVHLFGMAGLYEDGVRVSLRGRDFEFALSGAACTSPVGSEHAAGISLQLKAAPSVAVGIRMDGAVTSLDAFERSAALSTSTTVITRISQRWSAAWSAEDLILYGEKIDGMDMSLSVAAYFAPPVTLFTTIRIDRWGEVSTGHAASIRMGASLGGRVGYEGASEQIQTAVELSHGRLACEIRAFFHPVLGLSNGIFLQWRR